MALFARTELRYANADVRRGCGATRAREAILSFAEYALSAINPNPPL